MIFARYKGPDIEGTDLTPGKVYFARPEMDNEGVVGFDFIEVVDDSEETLRVNPDKDEFEYLDEVYAVVVKPFDELEVGEVTVVDDVVDGMLSVKGLGLRHEDDLVVVDRTNLYPGISLLDLQSGRWEKVKRVDECMWVLVDDQDRMRSPSEFRFAVSEGSILIEPLVRCVDETGENGLTRGHAYYLKSTTPDGLMVVTNDEGEDVGYMPCRFEW